MIIDKNKITIDFSHRVASPQEFNNLDEWQIVVFNLIEEYFNQDEFSIPTSGTTGKSKNILVKKEYLIASAKKTNDFFNLKKGDHSLLVMNPKFIGGRMMIIRAIERQLKLTIVKPSNSALDHIDEDFDFSAMVPMQVQESIRDYPQAFNRIKHVIIGGGAVNKVLLDELIKFKTKTYSTFGMTETLSHIAIKDLTPVESANFKLLQGIKISSKEDCLVIHAPELGVSDLITKDIVELTKDGFRWLGRADNMINSGGVKIFPELIEEKLRPLISSDYFVSSMKDEKFGEAVIIIIERETSEKIEFGTVLDKFEIPKKVFNVSAFDRTETGKIKRKSVLTKLGID